VFAVSATRAGALLACLATVVGIRGGAVDEEFAHFDLVATCQRAAAVCCRTIIPAECLMQSLK